MGCRRKFNLSMVLLEMYNSCRRGGEGGSGLRGLGTERKHKIRVCNGCMTSADGDIHGGSARLLIEQDYHTHLRRAF